MNKGLGKLIYAADLGNILSAYFIQLFSSTSLNTHLLANLSIRKFSQDDINALSADFTDSELFEAANQLGKWKSPGPDGLPIGFHWKEVTGDVFKLLKGVISGATDITNINQTDIVLIPKGQTQ